MSIALAHTAPPSHLADVGPRRRLDECRSLIRLALPIMAIALVNMGMSLTDTAMVAAIFGTDALAAVAVGSDLYSIVFYLGAGTLAGVGPFYTAAVGRADTGAQARLERIGWTVVALLAALTVPLVWTAPDWLDLFGLDPALLATGRGYTQTLALTLVPMLGVVLYRTLLTAAEKPRVFLKVTLAMLPLNAAANYVLMTGAGPFPALGPTGAGLSSLIVATASLAVLAAIARRNRPAGGTRAGLDRTGLAAVLRVGVPIGIATVTEVGIFLGATLYAARLGAADVAAHTLTLRIAGVAYAIPTALLQASMVRIARADSVGDQGKARDVLDASLGLSLVLGLFVCLALTVGVAPLAPAFFDTGAAGVAAAGLASGLLVTLGVIHLVANPGLAAAGLLRGRKDTRAPMVYALAGNWAVGAPLGIGLCEFGGLGITGIWIGLAAGMTTTAILTLARLLRSQFKDTSP